MLEGLEVSEVLLSSLEYSGRLDAEYYRPEYLKNEELLQMRNSKLLSSLSDFLIGPFGSAFTVENYIDDKTYRYIRGKDVKQMCLMDDDNVYMPKADFERLSKYALRKNDILVSVVGTLGNAAIVEDDHIPAIFSCKSTVLRTNRIRPHYILAYLNSSYGRSLLLRKERGAVQKGLNLDDLKMLDVYVASDAMQEAIEHLYLKSIETRNCSKSTYKQAEALLLDALNLSDFSPNTANSNIKSFKDSFATTGRLDAEYYQPKFDEIETLIKMNSEVFKRIGEIQTYNSRGMTAIYDDAGTIDMITQKHILETGLDYDNFDKTDIAHFTDDEAAFVKENDILIYGTGANIGRAQPYLRRQKAVACQDIIILRVTVDPVYVAFVINSFIGRLQTEKMRTGSAQPHLYPKDIAQFLIPFVDKKIQLKIREMIISSQTLKKQSTALLEIAKRAVEIAIEESEAVGLEYLNQGQIS